MSNCTNMAFSFVGFAEWTCENHCSTSCVLLHWLTPLASLHVWFTLSSTLLLTLPKLFEAGLITRHLILLGNSCLWSLMVMNAFDLQESVPATYAFLKNSTSWWDHTSSTVRPSYLTSVPIAGNFWRETTSLVNRWHHHVSNLTSTSRVLTNLCVRVFKLEFLFD